MENEISTGDKLMIVRNNYFWLDENSNAGFIANGDIVEVIKIKEVIERYGFRFAKTVIQITDYGNDKELDVNILDKFILSENGYIREVA